MDLKTQATLLRVLEEKQFQRVGGGRTLTVDVRIIASSNKDLPAEIEAARFREDLYYRLNVIPIRVPPLRERSDDLEELAAHFLARSSEQNGISAKSLSPAALAILKHYRWPGNVREFKNLLERLSITLEKETIGPEDIPEPYNPRSSSGAEQASALFDHSRLKDARRAFETEFIRQKLLENRFDIAKTASRIGADKSHVQKVARKVRI